MKTQSGAEGVVPFHLCSDFIGGKTGGFEHAELCEIVPANPASSNAVGR